MDIKVIKTRDQHEAALSTFDRLMDLDPDPGTPEADDLQLLALLIGDYEQKNFPIDPPDPIEAIKFRMEQQGLRQRDLIPFIGSKSKVSEVLSRKRPLSLPMIRALSTGLDIPVEILAREPEPAPEGEEHIEWRKFPLSEMYRRGWLEADENELEARADEILRDFFQPAGSLEMLRAFYRRTQHSLRSARKVNLYALTAWSAQVVRRALREFDESARPAAVDMTFMRELARLSPEDEGPLLARDFLRRSGIALIIEAHLSRTYLDGCVIFLEPNRPVIGMTIRYDRIDNFWFTLMHELAHISLHASTGTRHFYDDLEMKNAEDPREADSDRLAMDALIPSELWRSIADAGEFNQDSALAIANDLTIHPAIVAGRMQFEAKNYRILSRLVGHRRVRRLFP
ncbi:MAG: hypothetical protein ACC700_20815, partial [Anaerolineales bacterium]